MDSNKAPAVGVVLLILGITAFLLIWPYRDGATAAAISDRLGASCGTETKRETKTPEEVRGGHLEPLALRADEILRIHCEGKTPPSSFLFKFEDATSLRAAAATHTAHICVLDTEAFIRLGGADGFAELCAECDGRLISAGS